MLNRPLFPFVTLVAVAVALSACGGSSTTAPTPSSGSSPSSTTASSSPTSSSPTTQVTVAVTGPRTVAELKSALLELGDLPSGFAIEPAGGSNGDGPVSSSRDSRCASLVKITNAKTAPGSKASSAVSFSGGQDGPFVDESIDAMGSADSVEALQASLKSAVKTCRRVTLSIPGQGSSTVNVALVSAPKFGDHTIAARMTANGGSLDGLEITQVTAGVNDVVVSLSFIGTGPRDIDGATALAVAKARKVLGGATSGT